ncbi:hypothetical protein [Bacillus sp. BP-3]|uniref:hypothetical protein n=1 Tax=Bacillus sp. BP-3 TaxID=3022773 RepID=UPI00232E7407|nr:hypothetical protein [Bacillus sp. BP-3]MDC2863772.1 hypothetical protein [Bacillus sp. BP-3]
MKESIGNLNDIKAWMVFLVVTMEDQYEIEVEVSCGEDIENYMKLYLEQNWKELFEYSNFNSRDVCDASFQGIQMLAEDKVNNHSCYIEAINGGRRRANIKIDREILKDNNKDKLNRIKEIINS